MKRLKIVWIVVLLLSLLQYNEVYAADPVKASPKSTSTVADSDLEVVISLPFRPGNVTVSDNGEVFATVHPLGNPALQLIKVNPDGSYRAFPSESWQHDSGRSGTPSSFDTPLRVRTDSRNRLWVLDMGLSYGSTRLFAFDIATGAKVFEYELPASVAPKGSFVQDLAVDDRNDFAYLADISDPGIIVVDLKRMSARRIARHSSFLSEDRNTVIDGTIINFGGVPARVGVNPITLSADGETLFFGAMNGTTWYHLPAQLLRNGADDDAIHKAIAVEAGKPISDGAATDVNGNHYFTNINDRGIDLWSAKDRVLRPVIRDHRLDWPDNVAIGKDGALYVAVNQLYKTPAFSGGDDTGKPPYFIYKLKLQSR